MSLGATLRSNRLNNPYRGDTGPSNPANPSANDLAEELRRLLDQKYERPRAPSDGHYSLRSVLERNDAYQARRGLHDGYSQSRSRYHRASQFAEAERFHQHDEDPYDTRYADPPRAEHDDSDYWDRSAAVGPHDEEKYDDTPHMRRSCLVTALALIGFATVATAGTYAYRTYYVGADSTQTSAAPSHAKPAQPGIRGAPPAAAGSGYVVQVSAQRSKADAEASFRLLQDKFPIQLGGRTAIVRRADLGAKGIYYRAMVGPFASAGEAGQFCGRFKAAGGQCVIQRN
jgi:hypothetical protein